MPLLTEFATLSKARPTSSCEGTQIYRPESDSEPETTTEPHQNQNIHLAASPEESELETDFRASI
jgi:hypothetical protein